MPPTRHGSFTGHCYTETGSALYYSYTGYSLGYGLKTVFVVLWDIVTANIKVAILVLGPSRNLKPKWFRVPLESDHEQVNSLLAMIITTTPGTVSAGIDQERGDILVHALSAESEEEEIETIKQRYEAPLLIIFNVEPAQGEIE